MSLLNFSVKLGVGGMDTLNISDGNYTVFVDQSLTA